MFFLAKAYSLLAEGPQSHCDLDNICHPWCMNHHFRNHNHIVHLSQQPYYHRLRPQQLLKWIMRLFTALFNNTRSPKFKSQLTIVFLLPSIIIMITSNYPWNSETHKVDRNTITAFRNHKPCHFELVEVSFCFLRGTERRFTAAKKARVCWSLNFRVRV